LIAAHFACANISDSVRSSKEEMEQRDILPRLR
jgi:hypothetical protein